MPPLKLTRVANEQVPFGLAARWAGLPVPRDRGTKADCIRCGSSDALRLYRDHGWCFSCRTRFSVVVLLAEAWDMGYEDAAMAALDKIGYVPMDWAARWEHAQREPELDRAQLGESLKVWCSASLPDWEHRQYEEVPARVLAVCLGLLPRVRTAQDCDDWRSRCKLAMQRVCGQIVAELPDSG